MTSADLASVYRGYIDCLNRRAWDELGAYVREDVVHNGRPFGLGGYRAMLERDVREIPDLRFTIDLLVSDASVVGARLLFDCTPAGEFLGLPVNGRRVAFTENIFYVFRKGRIATAWSVIDKAAVEAQLG